MPEPPPEIASLKQVPFFAHLDAHRLQELVRRGHRCVFAADRTIFEAGDEPDGMYVVLAGRAELVRRDADGHELHLATFEAGSFFGELALLEGRPRSATVITLEPCECFLVNQTEFMECLASTSPDVVVRVVAAISRMVRDATERLWNQELASEKLHAEMEIARHRAVGQMVAGVAHELNTPLGIANTAADMIEKRCHEGVMADRARDDPALRAIVEDVHEASRLLGSNVVRAHRLVESFKQVSVREASEMVETVDAGQVVRDVLNLFRLNARRGHLSVRFEDRRDPSDGTWTGTPSHVTQLLLNLLTNVERYAYPDGNGGAVEIELATAVVAGQSGVELTVRDFGCGIPPEHHSQIFEPFFTTGRSRGGTGLGLAIVHNLATSVLGGTIQIDSEIDRGTTVTVALPSRPVRREP
jgi:signal transduction histidine kinase